MEKISKHLPLAGIIVGVIVIAILLAAGYQPCKFTILGMEFPLECDDPGKAPRVSLTPEIISMATSELTLETKPDEVIAIRSTRGVQIMERGIISIGIRHDSMYPMFFQDGGENKGFEIDLATEIVRRLFGNQFTIEWIPLKPEERFPALENNQIDFLIRNTTHTKSREAQALFTSNYFLDGVRLLVRRNEGYQSIQDLDGKTIVFPNDTSVPAVQNAAKNAGVNINVIVDADVATVFNERRADAIAIDWSSHGLFVEDYNAHRTIDELFSREPLAILMSLNDPVFRAEIDNTLLAIISDGTWQAIYDNWFPEPHPWSIEEMLAEPPADR